MDKSRLTVVGEGLVGSVLAAMLAKRGFHVDVYERRADPRTSRVDRGRSINLALSTRGIHALEQLGIADEILARAVPMMGRMIHPVSGKPVFQRYGKDDSEHINSISRAWLNERLIEHAERSRRVKLRFDTPVLGMDFRRGRLRLEGKETAASPVFGTDGSASAIRRDMLQLPRFDYAQSHLAHGYKELTIPAGEDGAFPMEKNALHIWPRGSYMLIALPNFEGSFTVTLFLPFEGPLSFDSLRTAKAVLSFFKAQFPDALALMPDLAEQFFANPTGAMITVKCGRWSVGDKALLLGDAAHAIVPFYGQGMNCGLEDCSVLDETIEERLPRGGWQAVFERFTELRKPEADAIADMAVENFIEMRDRVADPRFRLEKEVEHLLEARFPGRYIPRYTLVTFTRLPYSLAQRAGAVESRMLAELCGGLGSADEVDYEAAERLIERNLKPVLSGDLSTNLQR